MNDKSKVVEKCLNPMFYRTYELDAKFPDDAMLTVQIMDEGFMDTLIGETTIDLEDRYFGDSTTQAMASLNSHRNWIEA